MIIFRKEILFLALFIFCQHSIFARKVNRDVLAFWDSSETEEDEYTFSPVHRYLEFIFNHYGIRLTYIDVNKKFPKWLNSKDITNNYEGVVSWFTDNSMKEAEGFMKALNLFSKANKSILILGEPGFHMVSSKKNRDEVELKKFWKSFGINYKELYYSNPLLMSFKINSEPKDVQFERDYQGEIPGFWALSIDKKNTKGLKPWMTIKTKEALTSEFHPIVVGKKFALIQRGFETFMNPIDYKMKWRVNPFKIVKEVFRPQEYLFPDLTTQCGRRASFIHIDGDGFINISLIDKKSLSGEIIVEEIIKKYKFPTSASIVTAEVDPRYLGNEKALKAVREMYKLPYVEAATHTFRHPLSWDVRPKEREREVYLKGKDIKEYKGSIVAYKRNLGVLNYKEEVITSKDYIDKNLLPPGKKTKMVFWTGSCRPPQQALDISKKAGLLNINGGDGRYDGTYSSYAGLSPYYRKLGDTIQPYSAFANENIYTNLWEGPFSGFRNVIKSFENTETPIRVKPINIYYHFYSGERVSSLKALHEVYSYLEKQEVFPLYASDYSQMVLDWNKFSLQKIDKTIYKIENYGKVRTFRLEGEQAISLSPDYEKSKNVVGHRVHQGVLYITLSKGKEALLYLTKSPAKRPYIESCNGFIDTFSNTLVTGQGTTGFEAKIIDREKDKETQVRTFENNFSIEEWRK